LCVVKSGRSKDRPVHTAKKAAYPSGEVLRARSRPYKRAGIKASATWKQKEKKEQKAA
jgi:hypothetical protein